jgi:hypothetical protein
VLGQRRKRTLVKLGEVCKKIERIMAGQSVSLGDISLPQEGDAAPTPLERLRAFKKLLGETLEEIARGEPRRCDRCQRELPEVAVSEMPWAFRCAPDAPGCAPPA